MKIKSAEFEISAPDLKSCPKFPLPEFALIGRSNVGKSSLLNLLTGRNKLALVSATPGKTKLLNFFRINGNWRLVDLPGYGYAKVEKGNRFEFNQAVANYIEKRECLRGVFVLVDGTLPPQKIDLEFIHWLAETGKPFSLVATKCDRQSPTATKKNLAVIGEALREIFGDTPDCIPCSSKTGDGSKQLLSVIEVALAEGAGGPNPKLS